MFDTNCGRRQFLKTLASAGVCIGLLGCGAEQSGSASDANSDQATTRKIAMILDGPASDGGWNSSCNQAMTDAASDLGWETALTENADQSDWVTVGQNYIDQGFDLIFLPGNEFTDTASQLASDNPDAHLCVLNSDVSMDGVEGLVPNATQIGQLAGALAGILTKTNSIAFIGGTELDTTKTKLENYTQAAQKVNPSVTVTSAYAGSFTDAAKGKEFALSMVNSDDADVFFGDASVVDTGVRETLSTMDGVYDIGQPGDLGSADDPLIANSVVTDNTSMLKQAMEDVESGSYGNKVIYGDLSNGGVSVGTFSSIVTSDQQSQYLEYVDQIKDGTFL
jgi:basic membrane protein A